jgi:hypothetical protein
VDGWEPEETPFLRACGSKSTGKNKQAQHMARNHRYTPTNIAQDTHFIVA